MSRKKKVGKVVPLRNAVKPTGSVAADRAAVPPLVVTREFARKVFDQVGATRGRQAKAQSKGAPVRPPAPPRNAGRRKS